MSEDLEAAGHRLDGKAMLGKQDFVQCRFALTAKTHSILRVLAEYRGERMEETMTTILNEALAPHMDEVKRALGL